MLTVVETTTFSRYAADVWTESERHAFIDWISEHHDEGVIVPHSGGLKKVRWRLPGMGKRGGARVIYFCQHENGEVWLLMVYTKSKYDNIPAHVLKAMRDAI